MVPMSTGCGFIDQICILIKMLIESRRRDLKTKESINIVCTVNRLNPVNISGNFKLWSKHHLA
jgi:hypothetical protein